MNVKIFKGRKYKGKRRNYSLDAVTSLVVNGPQTFTEILKWISREETKRSELNEENISRRVRGTLGARLNELQEKEYIVGRSVTDKYLRNKMNLTLKGILGFLLSVKDSPYENESLNIKINVDPYGVRSLNFKKTLVENFTVYYEFIKFITSKTPIKCVIIIWLSNLQEMYKNVNLDAISLKSIYQEFYDAYALARDLMIILLELDGIVSMNWFNYREIDTLLSRVNDWLKTQLEGSELCTRNFPTQSGNIELNNFEFKIICLWLEVKEHIKKEILKGKQINWDYFIEK